MRSTWLPSHLAIALLVALDGGAAAAASDAPQPAAQSPAVQVIRGPEIDSFGNPIAAPTAASITTADTKSGSVLVLRGAPSPLPSAASPRQAPPSMDFASTTGSGLYGVGFFDGRRSGRDFRDHDRARRHRAVQGTTVPSISNVPSRHGGTGGNDNGFGGANSGLGGFSGGFGGFGGVGGFRR
jgi:hypothetical protein